jgi:Zn finger protein HypA/HybF involved in hydrogenase expression
MKKPVIYCPCCQSKLFKVDSTEYRCEDCEVVFDIVQYTIKEWEDADSIMVRE